MPATDFEIRNRLEPGNSFYFIDFYGALLFAGLTLLGGALLNGDLLLWIIFSILAGTCGLMSRRFYEKRVHYFVAEDEFRYSTFLGSKGVVKYVDITALNITAQTAVGTGNKNLVVVFKRDDKKYFISLPLTYRLNADDIRILVAKILKVNSTLRFDEQVTNFRDGKPYSRSPLIGNASYLSARIIW